MRFLGPAGELEPKGPGLSPAPTSLPPTALDGIIVGLQQLLKVSLGPPARLCDHSLPLLQLVPEACVGPTITQLVQHLGKQTSTSQEGKKNYSRKNKGTIHVARVSIINP